MKNNGNPMNLALPILVLFAVTSSGLASGVPKFESELFERVRSCNPMISMGS